jgi:hypothetical protein
MSVGEDFQILMIRLHSLLQERRLARGSSLIVGPDGQRAVLRANKVTTAKVINTRNADLAETLLSPGCPRLGPVAVGDVERTAIGCVGFWGRLRD